MFETSKKKELTEKLDNIVETQTIFNKPYAFGKNNVSANRLIGVLYVSY